MDIERLQTWYEDHHRDLPFRRDRDPYHIWISEIMLQQTQVDTVLPYYARFLARYPDVRALASAHEDELKKVVEGIGYYRRFSLMMAAAKQIVDRYEGHFPDTYEAVRGLPGIGAYTAGAILSIAFDQPYSALDGNVVRVLARDLGDASDMRQEKNRRRLDALNQSYVTQATPHIYTQAIMELGALVCRPQQPLCPQCPLNQTCVAYRQQLTDHLPVISKAKKPTVLHFTTYLLEKDGAYYVKKKEEGLLRGMYLYPQFEASPAEARQHLEALGLTVQEEGTPQTYKHVFTHQVWIMQVVHARLIAGTLPDYRMLNEKQLADIPMAIAHRKIKQ